MTFVEFNYNNLFYFFKASVTGVVTHQYPADPGGDQYLPSWALPHVWTIIWGLELQYVSDPETINIKQPSSIFLTNIES